MAELTQYKESQPILNLQKINSTGEGADAFAQMFGEVGKKAQSETLTLLDEQSEASLLQSQNQLRDTVTGARINLLYNPDLADKINQDSRETINGILDNSYVNTKHRRQLDDLANTYGNQIDLLSAEAGHKQSIKDAQISMDVQFPKTLQTIDDLYTHGKPEQAHKVQDNLVQMNEMALRSGAITPERYSLNQRALEATIERAQKTLEMLQNGGTAAQYHALKNPMYGSGDPDKANMPSNEYTSYNASHYDEESSKAKALSDIYRYGRLVNPESVRGLKPDAYSNIQAQFQGANEVKANIESGTNQLVMEKMYADLNDKGKKLSLADQGKRGYINNYYSRLENGEFLQVIQETTQGQRIQQAALQRERAIQNSSQFSDEEKQAQSKQNSDWEKQQYINLWEGLHGDSKYIKLMKPAEMMPYHAAFKLGGDPELLISSLRATDPSILPYVADSMPTSTQQAVVSVIGQAGNNITKGLASEMVYANQTGYQGKIIGDKESGAPTVKKIEKLITVNNDIAQALKYMQVLPYDPKANKEKGSDLPQGTINMLRNTVLFQAERMGDYSVGNANAYISKMGVNMRKAYNIYTDSNMIFNRSTLDLDDHALASIGSYAKAEAYKLLQEQMPSIEFYDAIDRQPLMTVNTPNNHIVVVNSVTGQMALDKNGHALFDKPYTNTLMNAAKHHTNEQNYAHYLELQRKGEIHPFGKTFQ